jgi:NADPH:quinone reductase-like Zn-dependent oxidoreductase
LVAKEEVSPMVEGVFPVDQIAEPHDFVKRREFTGKVILKGPG